MNYAIRHCFRYGTAKICEFLYIGVERKEKTGNDASRQTFVKALEDDAEAFCERAKKYELLLVPSDSFGVTGYVRISYCVSTEQIEKSLPAFKKLAEEYGK